MQESNYLVADVDIAKDTFCAHIQLIGQKRVFKKDDFKSFLKYLPDECIVVMETSEPYFLSLAQYL
ncbi:MAG: hypothetical protein AAGI07_13325 [Bacteroidota bacterium]